MKEGSSQMAEAGQTQEGRQAGRYGQQRSRQGAAEGQEQ